MKNQKLLLTLLVFSPGFAFAGPESQEFNTQGLEKIRVKNMSGDIKVSPSKDEKVHVSPDKVNFEKDCRLKMRRSGKKFYIRTKKTGWFSHSKCQVNFKIQVPQSIALDFKNGSGNIDVNGRHGKVEFSLGSGEANVKGQIQKLVGETGSGSMKVNGKIDDLELKSGNGSITVTGKVREAELKTGSGDINVTYQTPPKNGKLEVNTGSGDAIIQLPAKSKVVTSLKSGNGDISNELGDSPDASFKISMKTGSGDLKIKKSK